MPNTGKNATINIKDTEKTKVKKHDSKFAILYLQDHGVFE